MTRVLTKEEFSKMLARELKHRRNRRIRRIREEEPIINEYMAEQCVRAKWTKGLYRIHGGRGKWQI